MAVKVCVLVRLSDFESKIYYLHMYPGLDTELVMLCFTLLAILASVLYLIFNSFSGKRRVFGKSKGSSKAATKERSATEDKDEWLKGTNAPGVSRRAKVRASTEQFS